MVLSVAEARKLTVPRLKEELSKRGLDSTGNKPDLLARLIASIEKAVEDSILDGTGPVEGILSDDILNDDILDAPIDGDDAEHLLNSSTDGDHQQSERVEKVEKEEVKKPAIDDVKLARAARFGLPVTGTASASVLASDSAKDARAKRFGLTRDAVVLGSEEAKQKRAERFGEVSSTETKDKLAARAARFGLPLNSNGKKVVSEEESEKLKERAKRFGLIDEDAEAKKKARLERFGAVN